MSSPVFDPLLGEMVLHEHAASATPPGGSDTQFQYNNAGAFGGTAKLVFDGTYIKFPSLPTSDPFVEGAAWNSGGTLKISAGTPSGWWLSGGISAGDCVAAYQAKGAASLAASYSNLNNPGTNDATLGVAPSWAAGTGWTFNGTSQYLKTGIIPNGANYSCIALTSGGTAATTRAIFGASDGTKAFSIAASVGATYYSNGNYYGGAAYSAGTFAVAGTKAYKDGVSLGASLTNLGTTREIYIAVRNESGTAAYFFDGTIIALAIYSSALSDSEVAAVTTAMAAL